MILTPIRCVRAEKKERGGVGRGRSKNEGSKVTKNGKMKYEVGAKFINNACAVTVPQVLITQFQEAQKCMSDPCCLYSLFFFSLQCTLQSSTQSIDCVTLRAIDQGSKLTGEMDGAGTMQRDGVRDGSTSLLCGQCVIYGRGSVSHRDQRWGWNWLANKCRQRKNALTESHMFPVSIFGWCAIFAYS